MRGGSLRELYVVEGVRGGFAWEEGEPSTPLLAEHFARFGWRSAKVSSRK